MNRKKGIIAIIISALGFSLMNLFIPLSGNLPTIQKSFFRNLIAFFVASFVFLKDYKSGKFSKADFKNVSFKILILRSILGTIGIYANYYALDKLLISDASVLNKIAPFATLIFSFLFLKEKLSRENIISIIIAFIGVIFVVKPSLSSSDILPYLIGILGGLSAGAAYTSVRALNKRGVNSSLIVGFFSLFSTLVSLPYLLFNYTKMSLTSFLCLVLVGVFASIGQYGVTLAYKFAPSSEISIFDYFTIIFTGIWGLLFLNQKPDILSLFGYVIIFSAVLINFISNRKKQSLNSIN